MKYGYHINEILGQTDNSLSGTKVGVSVQEYFFAVGLDSEKRIVSEKMRKEAKRAFKEGKKAKRWGKEANLMS